jgi:uncharacterized membrane protein YidH (DUF202 family)
MRSLGLIMEIEKEQKKIIYRAAGYLIIGIIFAVISKILQIEWLVTLSAILLLIIIMALSFTLAIYGWRSYKKHQEALREKYSLTEYSGFYKAFNIVVVSGAVIFFLIFFGIFNVIYKP